MRSPFGTATKHPLTVSSFDPSTSSGLRTSHLSPCPGERMGATIATACANVEDWRPAYRPAHPLPRAGGEDGPKGR